MILGITIGALTLIAVGALILIAVVFFIIASVRTEPSADVTEEQGPMPKRHGSFGQRVHGGK